MSIPKEVTIYAAGFFDGEGCVQLTGQKKDHIMATMAQVNTAPLEYIQKFYGGRLYFVLHKSQAQKYKTNGCYRLDMTGESARTFLRDIYEYCLVKQGVIKSAFEQAQKDLEAQQA